MFKGSIVALVTPIKDGKVDVERLIRLVEFHIEEGTNAIVAGGTTGESLTLSHEDKLLVIKTVVDAVKERLPVIAGTGQTSTRDTILLSKEAMELGVHGVLVMTPQAIKPTQQGLYQHYKMLAEAVPLPIILYNVPGRTACDLLPETVAALSSISNIVGIKDATANLERLKQLSELCHGRFDVFSGDDFTAAEWMLHGARGVISVTANICPRLVAKMADAALNEERELCLGINESLSAINEFLFVEANPIPVKWALFKMGLIENELISPLTPLSDAHHEPLLNLMKKLELVVGAN